MSLSRRASLLAAARPRDETGKEIMLVAGAVAIVVGWAVHPVGLMVGGILVGYALRPSAERYYLEGFADGLVATELDAGRPAPDRGGDRGQLDPLPAGAGLPAGYADAAGHDAPRAPGYRFAPTGAGGREYDLANAFGVHGAAGPPRSPLDEAGQPVVSGPRRPSVVPPAVVLGPVGGVAESARPAADAEAGRRKRKGTGTTLESMI